MSKFIICLLVALGASTWIYTKLQNKSGNNTSQSLTASGVAAVSIFIILFGLLSLVI